jgi:signal peptidase II
MFFHRSKQEAKELLAELRPAAVVPRREVVTREPVTERIAPAKVQPVERPDVGRLATAPRTIAVEPLTADLRRLHLTVSREFLALLEKAKAGESHVNPGASAEQVLLAGLRLLVERQGKRKASVPAKVKREVLKRDEGRCTWPLASGGVCGSTARLEVATSFRGGAAVHRRWRTAGSSARPKTWRQRAPPTATPTWTSSRPARGSPSRRTPPGYHPRPTLPAMSPPPTAPQARAHPSSRPPSRWLLVSLLLGVAVVDQVTKWIALSFLPHGRRFSFLGDTFRLEHARNLGGFLGAGAGLGAAARGAIFLWGVAIVTLAAAAGALSGKFPRWQAIGMALVAGGGAGNLIDRVRTGSYVVDFMNVGLGWLRTGVFNVADMAIMAGIGLMLLPGPRRTGDDPTS